MEEKDEAEERRRRERLRGEAFLLELLATLYSVFDARRRAPTFLELVPGRYCVYEWVCERDTHAARAWHRCASTRRARRPATLRRRARRRWNCRLVAQHQSFDFIREPSNINWWRLESDCCRRAVLNCVGILSADAILVPVRCSSPFRSSTVVVSCD